MDRECNKCIHHTSGMCSSWDCKMQTVEDLKRETREKAIDDFVEALRQMCRKNFEVTGVSRVGLWEIHLVAKELKGNKVAEEKEG